MRRPLLVLAFLCLPALAQAQWIPNGRAVSTAAATQKFPAIAPDGNGGAIIAWQDRRAATNDDIYAQRMSAGGIAKWSADGIVICNVGILNQQKPAIVSDGNKGAIILWQDFRNGSDYDTFAQRVDSLGVAQWTAGGKFLGGLVNDQVETVAVSDGAGGAFYACMDGRAGAAAVDVYAQHIDASGAPQWAGGFGVAVCTANATQNEIRLAVDGSGGLFVVWQDARSNTNDDVYVQHVNASGVVTWTANGVNVAVDTSEQNEPAIVGDGAGGCIVAWQDFRTGGYDIYAQRFNSFGVPQWTANGLVVSNATGGQVTPRMISDGAGGAIMTWQDNRSEIDVYAERIDGTGASLWTANGVAICTAAGNQSEPGIVPTAGGGAIMLWRDVRGNKSYDVYAQRVNSAGVVQWYPNGVPLCTAPAAQMEVAATADGNGGVIAAWNDARNGPSDIYAMRAGLTLSGAGATMPAAAIALRNYPNPFTGSTEMDVVLSRGGDLSVEIFDAAGRRVSSRVLVARSAGVEHFTFDGRDDAGHPLPSGVYFCRATGNGASVTKKMVLVH